MDRKQIAVIVLSIAVFGLILAAIGIAIQLEKNQAPTDTSASTVCGTGFYPGSCGGYIQEFGSDPTSCASNERVCYPSGSDALGECVADSSCSCIAASKKCSGASPCYCGPSFDAVCQTSSLCQESQGWCSAISCIPKGSGTVTPTPTVNPTCGPAGCDGDTRPQCYPYVAGSSQLSIQNSDCSVKRTGDSCTQKNSSGSSTGVSGTCQSAPSCSCVAAAPTPTTTLHSCGQHCNQATGLCQTGFTCAFDNNSCVTSGPTNQTTYCIPDSVYNASSTCNNPGVNTTDKYITNPSGPVNQAYINSLCGITTTTPTTTPTVSPTNTPTLTPTVTITSTPTAQPTSTSTVTATTSQSPTPTVTVTSVITNTPTVNPTGGAGLPDTGVFDDTRFLIIGMTMLVMAYVTYKLKIGRELSENLIDNVSGKINKIQDGKPFMPFEESTLDAMEKKRKKKKKNVKELEKKVEGRMS